MKLGAFLSLEERGDFVIDDELALAPLAERGWRMSTLSWRQEAIPWRRFDAVVIRSTWDYWNDVPAFLEALSRIDRQTRLANPLSLVHWNLAKTYLQDLEGKGVRIVPTLWLDALEAPRLRSAFARLGTEELVVKPVVGANGEDAFRVCAADPPDHLRRVAQRFRNRECMVQPFLSKVLSEGEYSLFYFNGSYSHAIVKVPQAGEFRSQEERGAEIRLVTPPERLRNRGDQALASLDPVPLYARVDFVGDAEAEYLLMELELIEPSMYLRTDSEAPARFARAMDDWFRAA